MVVQLAVDKSRSVCLSVAHGEVDVAIIGGHVPEDLKDVLQARQLWPYTPGPHCCTICILLPLWALCGHTQCLQHGLGGCLLMSFLQLELC